VQNVELAGSRAGGTPTAFSEWEFGVETDDLDALAAALPELLAPLEPLAEQWDPLGEHPTYMLMLRGPTKIDLIFVHESMIPRPPWQVSAETLAAVDAHFWDWILWLAAKRAAARDELVGAELEKMHRYLLQPLGARAAHSTIEEAVEDYLSLLTEAERRFGLRVPRALREEVLPALLS
jgi:hypothetical protein